MEKREIRAPAGRITACLDGGLLRARGISYAHAPRWQHPRPLPARAITALGPARACPQLPIPRLDGALPGAFAGLEFHENCLDLSITAPDDARDLPVILWLHGGSYESGAADMAVFDPSVLVRDEGVVFVSVSYRLGVFGWLSGAGRPANLGAFDVIAALEWVARNIESFGGDPGRVTLFGQSSGGDLAARLMLAPAAQGLFRRAIIESAPLALPLGAARMRRVMRRLAARLAPDAALLDMLAAQERIRRGVRRFGLAGQMPFGPEFGAPPFPPEADLAAAHHAIAPEIAVMIGHLRDEAALFLPPPEPTARLFRRGVEPLRRAATRHLTRRLYARPARDFAARHAGAGGQVARFVLDWGHGALGPAHLADLPLIFPGPAWLGTPLLPGDMGLAELTQAGAPLRALWAGFARDAAIGADQAGLIRFETRP
ncbi:MAG: carboxylesterase family protein [Paracoccus sp. (in: a-proteobacteria)]|nr:carboxylesterase family protein [Paracoccus sp. (in: a-proteobacteria)]